MSARVNSIVATLAALLLAGPAEAECPISFEAEWSAAAPENGPFFTPVRLTFGPQGTLFLTDLDVQPVVKEFTGDGQFIRSFGTVGTGPGAFASSLGIAVSSDGRIYAGDYVGGRVQVFDPIGNYLFEWSIPSVANPEIGFPPLPTGIAIAPDGSVFVAEAYNGRVFHFTSSGEFIAEWYLCSESPCFRDAQDLAVDQNGNIFVLEASRDRIHKLAPDGTMLISWGASGAGEAEFQQPWGICVDAAGTVYVADGDNRRVLAFSSDGDFYCSWGEFGTDPAEFVWPVDVAVDDSGAIYVVDGENRKVVKFAQTPVQASTSTWGRVKASYR